MGTFEAASATRRQAGGFTADLDEEWFIWGPFGGYLAAIVLDASCASTSLPLPATFSCQFLNTGAAGVVEIDVEALKSGKRAACLQSAVSQDGKDLLKARSWFLTEGLTGLDYDQTRSPDVELPENLPLWDGFGDDEARRPIWARIERKPVDPKLRTAGGSSKARWVSWVRLKDGVSDDAPAVRARLAVLWLDMAPWNAALAHLGWPTSHVAPTLDLSVHFAPDLFAPHFDPCEWVLVETESPVSGSGLFGARMTLWSRGHSLLATGSAQCLCVPNPHYGDPRTGPGGRT